MRDPEQPRPHTFPIETEVPSRKSAKVCGICEQLLDEAAIDICQKCKEKGPPTWSECRGEIEFHYKMMRYRNHTELTTHHEKLAAFNEIDRELVRCVRMVQKVREARRLLPAKVDDLSASAFKTVLSALPLESWKRVTEALEKSAAVS